MNTNQTLKTGDVIVFTGNDHRYGELGVVTGELGCCSIPGAYYVETRQDYGKSEIGNAVIIPDLTSFEIIDHDIDKNEVRELVARLITIGFSEAEIERALDLPRRSLTTDKSQELIALLKIVNKFPWMIRVAEKDYTTIAAKKIICHAAVDIMFSENEEVI